MCQLYFFNGVFMKVEIKTTFGISLDFRTAYFTTDSFNSTIQSLSSPLESGNTPSINRQHIPRNDAECGEDEKSEVNILACTSDRGKSISIFCNVSCSEGVGEKKDEDEDGDGDEDTDASAENFFTFIAV